MNRYLSIMSQPIRNHGGIIDKYIGDAIMAYWGPPFTEDAEQARLACLAALDMVARVEPLQAELPELLGSAKCRLQSTCASALQPARRWSGASGPSS